MYIHWNQIKADGGAAIFKALTNNDTLKVLDISWNSIGQGQPSCAPQICEFFKTNKIICHLDMSNNNLGFDEAQEIQKAVIFNRTIYGLHFIGNYGLIDNNGFIQLDEKQKEKGEQINVKRIDGVKAINKNSGNSRGIPVDNCWICNGYQQANFEWTPGVSGQCSEKPIYIHFQYEDYAPRYMGKMKPNFKFWYKRMAPYQEEGKYFFTADNKQEYAKDSTIQELKRPQKIRFQIFEDKFQIALKTFNKICNGSLEDLCLNSDYKPNYQILPRTRLLVYKRPNQRVEKKWSIPISVFKDWKTDNDDLLKKCFEFDWNNNKIAKFIKNDSDREKIKNILRSNYKNYKDCYRYYSSYQPLGDIWALQNYSYSEFVRNCNIYEGDIQEADINLKWTSTVSGNAKGNIRMPERGMIRCQLMECIVRISEEKFLKNGIVQNMFEATEKILNEYMIPEFTKYDAQGWRDKTYWTEKCDDCIKFYKVIIDKVYQMYSVKKVKPGQKNFMCLDELNDICKALQLYDENFVERDMNFAFNLSMMTQIDEINNDRIFQMSFVEFLEAISRIAEKKCLQPYATEGCDHLSYQQRSGFPLHVKMESLFVLLLRICDANTQANFRLPKKSIFFVEEEKAGSESD